MRLVRKLLPLAYPALRLCRVGARALHSGAAGRLRVLLYHDIAPDESAGLARQLRWIAKRWRFATPEQFAAMVSGKVPINGDQVLLTFDDGFASNRQVAESVLNPLGIKAVFFVVPEFVACGGREAARDFIGQNIFPGRLPASMPPHWDAMGWHDLEALLDQGHTIGSHTARHARLSMLGERRLLEAQICQSREVLEKRLGTTVDHFAFPFGDLASFSREALAAARQCYRFVHTGLRGDNGHGPSPLSVWRESLSAGDSLALVGAFLEGAVDWRYAKSRAVYRGWGEGSDEAQR